MPEVMKVGIVYRDRDLRVFNDFAPQGVSWRFELFHENALREGPVSPRREFLAVFFPAEDPAMPGLLARYFPGAEFIAYQTSPEESRTVPEHRKDGLLLVKFPADFAVTQHLLESYALIETKRKELGRIRNRADQINDLLAAFTHSVESALDVNERKIGMNMLVGKMLGHFQAEECLIYLADERGGRPHRAYSGGKARDLELFESQANMSIVGNVMETGKPYVNNGCSFELKVSYNEDAEFIRSVLCLPLERRGERLGVLEFLNKEGGFTEEDQSLAKLLVEPLFVAIRTTVMFENSERLTITDDLTKLYNYRYLMQFLESEVKRCLRYKKKVSLLFIDVDGFKSVNDSFGHLVGSQALAEIGQVLRRILRETDVVGRYGGDEFVIVLPETPLTGAMIIAERIRKNVEDYEFVAQNVSIRLTVSLGVASCPKHTLTAEGLIKKADAAMYRAKELSKNSIKVAV